MFLLFYTCFHVYYVQIVTGFFIDVNLLPSVIRLLYVIFTNSFRIFILLNIQAEQPENPCRNFHPFSGYIIFNGILSLL